MAFSESDTRSKLIDQVIKESECSNPANHKELLNKLSEMNIDESQLNDLKAIFEAEESDIYGVFAHLSSNMDIKTRSERAIVVENSNFIEKFHMYAKKQDWDI